jgi:ankyrin repeat protein
MGDKSNIEALGVFSRLLGKKVFVKDESAAMSSLPSDGNLKQHPETVPLTSRECAPHQEERIEVGVDRMDFTQFHRYFSRIFEVVARGDHKALSNFLTNCVTKVNTIGSQGNTALHHAVASACRKADGDDSLYQCIKVLTNYPEINVNMPKKKGYTSVGYALNALHMTCIEHMLQHPSANRLYLHYCPGDREYTVRKIIVEIYPELQPLLPAPLIESLDSSDRYINLLSALQRDKYNICEANIFDLPTPNTWYDKTYHSSLLEIACQMKNRKEFVKILFDKGANSNIKNHVTGMPLIHARTRSGNFEVLQLLLEKERGDTCLKDKEKRTIPHWFFV